MRVPLSLVVFVCAALPLSARADTITTFQAVGDNSAAEINRHDTLKGTLTVNTTTGALVGVDLTLSDGPEFTVVNTNYYPSPGVTVFIGLPGFVNQAVLDFPVSTLVGYTGSRFNLASPYGGFDSLATPLTAPEPSSLALLGTGLLGLIGALKRRNS